MRIAIRVGIVGALMAVVVTLTAVLNRPAEAQPYPPPVGSVTLFCPTRALGEIRFGAFVLPTLFPIVAFVRDEDGLPIPIIDVLLAIDSEPDGDANIDGGKQATKTTNLAGIALARAFGGSTSGSLVISATADEVSAQCTVLIRAINLSPTSLSLRSR